MSNPLWRKARLDRGQGSTLRSFDPSYSYETEPQRPMQIFSRLGLLLAIALAFGLAAEILARLPPH